LRRAGFFLRKFAYVEAGYRKLGPPLARPRPRAGYQLSVISFCGEKGIKNDIFRKNVALSGFILSIIEGVEGAKKIVCFRKKTGV